MIGPDRMRGSRVVQSEAGDMGRGQVMQHCRKQRGDLSLS